MRKLTAVEEQELIKMYKQVEKGFESFTEIKTTEDLFRWREKVKEENNEDGKLRNEIIEQRIKGNQSLELLYAWSKFTRMVTRAKASLNLAKRNCGITSSNAYRLKASTMLHDHLEKSEKAREDRLFGIYKVEEIGLERTFPNERKFSNSHEYVKSLVKEDDQQPWPAVLFVTLMNAYGIEAEDLLTVGRAVEKKGREYVADIAVEHEAKLSAGTTNSYGSLIKNKNQMVLFFEKQKNYDKILKETR